MPQAGRGTQESADFLFQRRGDGLIDHILKCGTGIELTLAEADDELADQELEAEYPENGGGHRNEGRGNKTRLRNAASVYEKN